MIPQETPSLLFFTKEIFHRKHHLTCSENIYRFLKILYLEIFEKLRSVKTNQGNKPINPEIIWL